MWPILHRDTIELQHEIPAGGQECSKTNRTEALLHEYIIVYIHLHMQVEISRRAIFIFSHSRCFNESTDIPRSKVGWPLENLLGGDAPNPGARIQNGHVQLKRWRLRQEKSLAAGTRRLDPRLKSLVDVGRGAKKEVFSS